MIPLKKWWLTQASIDIVKDKELLSLMKKSGCIGVFLGLETFTEGSILDANKVQNRVKDYQNAIDKLHSYDIAVMSGIITGFDHDDQHSIAKIAKDIQKLNIDVPFISVMTPFKGTDLYKDFQKGDRILKERGWEYYNGYNVAYKPKNMTPEQLQLAHRNLWKDVFSLGKSLSRVVKSLFYLRPGAILLTLFMNGFYSFKRTSGNLPKIMDKGLAPY